MEQVINASSTGLITFFCYWIKNKDGFSFYFNKIVVTWFSSQQDQHKRKFSMNEEW